MYKWRLEEPIQLNVIVFNHILQQHNWSNSVSTTRKLSYRKDDRAMRPIYGCAENFRESWVRLRLIFSKFVMRFCSDLSMNVHIQNLKFVALPIRGIMDTPRLSFLQNFNRFLFGWTLWMNRPNLKSVTLLVPEIIGYTNHVRWASYISSSCKFLRVNMCQKLWKLAGSKQSYCKNYQAYFLAHPVHMKT